MKNLIQSFLLIACLTSCIGAQIPGSINKNVSDFDGVRELSMEPAWLYYSDIKLRLFRNSKMPKDQIILTAVIKGAESISQGKSLHFNVDGKIYSFSSIDSFTDIKTTEGFYGSGFYIPASNWSSKDYIVDKSFIEKIVKAERVSVKVNLGKTYSEGEFSTDGYTTARPAFRDFLKELEKF